MDGFFMNVPATFAGWTRRFNPIQWIPVRGVSNSLLVLTVLFVCVPASFGQEDTLLEGPVTLPLESPSRMSRAARFAASSSSATPDHPALQIEAKYQGTALNPDLALQLQNSVDMGDSYPTPKGRRNLRRLTGALAIHLPTGTPVDSAQGLSALARLTSPTGTLSGWSKERIARKDLAVVTAPTLERERLRREPSRLQERLSAARRAAGVRTANPVFIDPDSGLRLLCSDEVIVRLKIEVDPQTYFGPLWSQVRRVRGTKRQFILETPSPAAEKIFQEVESRFGDPEVEWAEPNFIGEIVKHLTPNDTDFPNQWHFNNTGQGGGTDDADVDAPEAWDTTTGSSDVVIAIIDDGIQLNHPDLSGNIFSNPGEVANGLDDDGNGYTDDLNGWDFVSGDNDPSPDDPIDDHGTATSGVAAAVGNNNLGVAGTAYTSRILPVKVITGFGGVTAAGFAEAIRYAGGVDDTGTQFWTGADVLSISLGFTQAAVVDDAFSDVAQFGRNGKGCPIFVSTGNSAGAWFDYTIQGFPSGTFTFRWEYVKDGSGASGDDTAWLDSVTFPGGMVEAFEAGGLPAGWTTGGDSNWTNVQDGVSGNHALTGWDGPASRAMRPGSVGNSQSTFLEVTKSVGAGDLRFWSWLSSESFLQVVPISGFSNYPLSPNFNYRRTQSIYLSSELGSAATISEIDLYLFTSASQSLDDFTIRMKHTSASSFASATWETAGWTVVYSASDVSLASTGFKRFALVTPFAYNGTDNLMLDISFSNSDLGGSGDGLCFFWNSGGNRTVRAQTNTDFGDPANWSGSTASPAISSSVPVILTDRDGLRISVDGTTYFSLGGTPSLTLPVSYPASHTDTIAVGASTNFDYRSDYSQYGSEMDLVAPSSGGSLRIATTDRTGSLGYVSGDYSNTFGGTSSSAPLVAGIGALVLSKNNSLSGAAVRDLMRNTADKIGDVVYSGGFNQFYGYGRVNAFTALNSMTTVDAHSSPQPDLDLSDWRTSEADKMTVLRFEITDHSGDGLPTLIDRLSVDVGGNADQAANDLAWAELVADGVGQIAAATLITNSEIVFGAAPDGNGVAGLDSVSEGTSIEYTVNLYLNTTLLGIDGQTYVFDIDETRVGVDSNGGSPMAGDTAAVTPVVGTLFQTMLGVSVTPDSWMIGPVPLNEVRESSPFIITNIGNVAQDFWIAGTNGHGPSGGDGWALSSAPGTDSFMLEADQGDDGTYETVLETSQVGIATNIPVSGNETVGLRYTAPTLDTIGAHVPQDLIVTVTATRHVP
jgi:subtilisin family serine protease